MRVTVFIWTLYLMPTVQMVQFICFIHPVDSQQQQLVKQRQQILGPVHQLPVVTHLVHPQQPLTQVQWKLLHLH